MSQKLETSKLKSYFSYSISSPIYLISNLLCYSHDITNFPSLSYTFSFSIPFLSFHSFILSFYRVLYNLYLNPNLLKILSNYTHTIPKVNPISLKILLNYAYTISKVTSLHIYIFTPCLIFFTHFQFSYFSFIFISILFLYSFFYTFLPFLTPFSILLHTFLSPLFFLYAFSSYFLTFPTHCLAVPKLILLYLLFHITILTVNIASCQATVPYFIWQLLISLVPLLNYCVIQPYCAITVPLPIIY